MPTSGAAELREIRGSCAGFAIRNVLKVEGVDWGGPTLSLSLIIDFLHQSCDFPATGIIFVRYGNHVPAILDRALQNT
jgi:hypothetical protein